MAYDEVSISNMALRRLGVSLRISALDEDSESAALCNEVYADLRDEVLRAWPWPFATTVVALALIEEEPTTEWGYAYQMPSDCLRSLRIVDHHRFVNPDRRIPFKIVAGDNGKVIHTNQPEAELEYIKAITDPARFDGDFASALAWRMAMEIGLPLARDQALTDRATQYYIAAVRGAEANAMNESYPDEDPDAGYIRARD